MEGVSPVEVSVLNFETAVCTFYGLFVASYFFICDILSGQSLSGPAPFLQLLAGLFSFGGFVGVCHGTRCRPAFVGVCLGFTHKLLLVLPFKLVSHT